VGGVSEEELQTPPNFPVGRETPEGRSIVVLAKQKYTSAAAKWPEHEARFIPFTPRPLSGVDLDGRRVRKGATDSVMSSFTTRAAWSPPN